MQKTNPFKQAIQTYLEDRAKTDSLFAVAFSKPNKSIEECLDYIVVEALKDSSDFKSGVKVGQIDNDVVFGMAVHYYDEDNIKVGKMPANVKASVSSSTSKPIELTEEDKQAARQAALRRLEEEQHALLRKKPTKAKKEVTEVQQMSLFES